MANDTSPQYWRLLTTFIYFGPLSLNLLFHIFFIQRYARMLEESATSVAHFAWLLFYAAATLLAIAPLSSQAFLGTTLSSTLVYIWSRRNPDTRLSFLGLLTFKAPWLPWVLIAFNVVLHGHWPKDELCGIVVGHSMFKHIVASCLDPLLINLQSGTFSTTSTHRLTMVTDLWTLQAGGSDCSSDKRCPSPIPTCMTLPSTGRSRSLPLLTFDDCKFEQTIHNCSFQPSMPARPAQ